LSPLSLSLLSPSYLPRLLPANRKPGARGRDRQCQMLRVCERERRRGGEKVLVSAGVGVALAVTADVLLAMRRAGVGGRGSEGWGTQRAGRLRGEVEGGGGGQRRALKGGRV